MNTTLYLYASHQLTRSMFAAAVEVAKGRKEKATYSYSSMRLDYADGRRCLYRTVEDKHDVDWLRGFEAVSLFIDTTIPPELQAKIRSTVRLVVPHANPSRS